MNRLRDGLRCAWPALLLLLLTAVGLDAQASGGTPGITRTPLFDNARASVTRVTFAPGARETEHTHPTDIMVILTSPAEIELVVADATTRGRQDVGKVFFIPANTLHLAANVGDKPFDAIVVTLKE